MEVWTSCGYEIPFNCYKSSVMNTYHPMAFPYVILKSLRDRHFAMLWKNFDTKAESKSRVP